MGTRVPVVNGHLYTPNHVRETRVTGPDGIERTARHETAFMPAPIHLAVDTETGVVYAGRSQDEAVQGIGYDRKAQEAEAQAGVAPIEYDSFSQGMHDSVGDPETDPQAPVADTFGSPQHSA